MKKEKMKKEKERKVRYCEQGCGRIATRTRLKTNNGLKWFCRECRSAHRYFTGGRGC